MTEDEWLTSADPQLMLAALQSWRVGWRRLLFWKATRQVAPVSAVRKIRLFACACSRRVEHLWTDPRLGKAVETAERFVDGRATGDELSQAHHGAILACEALGPLVLGAEGRIAPITDGDDESDEYWAAEAAVATGYKIHYTASHAAYAAGSALSWHRQRRMDEEDKYQAALLRDLFGNSFRSARSLGSSVLTWNGGTIPKLAAAIYEERAFDRLPVLADALEDAGCADAEVLGHCRGGGDHARGCWVVDLVLGKR